MDAIAAFDLTKQYDGKPALRGINLQVPEGRAMACVGRENAGKTTLVRLLAGLRRPTSGECSVLGLAPAFEAARLHSMAGVVLHTARLYDTLSLSENLRFFAGIHGVTKNQAVERSSALMHRLDIWEERDKRPVDLPTGVLHRASLARALMHRPRVVMIDEQGAGMDRETTQRVGELVKYSVQQEGVTVLMCTQNMQYVQEICDGFALLHQGILLARGDMETLRVGGGLRLRAALRMAPGEAGPQNFHLVGDQWQREIQSESEMPKLIAQVVGQGASLYEARVVRPGLEEIYQAYLDRGKRREASLHAETSREYAAGPCPEDEAAGTKA
ncbi:ABC transporter ATP-binding protein [Acutalibacter intestini]|uniref:ABC transporter ATP-binding protein n=1 Tax=Acutalibacter intestini TaxID=3093659 RepID=UPI002AC95CA1|nr:ABC transporter ATP-binding protein [Acutalibacter sp. M00204]